MCYIRFCYLNRYIYIIYGSDFAGGIFARSYTDDAAEYTGKVLRRDANRIGNSRDGHIGKEEGARLFNAEVGKVGVRRASRFGGKEGCEIRTVKSDSRRNSRTGKRLVIFCFHYTDRFIDVDAGALIGAFTQEGAENSVYIRDASVFGAAVGFVTHFIEVGDRSLYL